MTDKDDERFRVPTPEEVDAGAGDSAAFRKATSGGGRKGIRSRFSGVFRVRKGAGEHRGVAPPPERSITHEPTDTEAETTGASNEDEAGTVSANGGGGDSGNSGPRPGIAPGDEDPDDSESGEAMQVPSDDERGQASADDERDDDADTIEEGGATRIRRIRFPEKPEPEISEEPPVPTEPHAYVRHLAEQRGHTLGAFISGHHTRETATCARCGEKAILIWIREEMTPTTWHFSGGATRRDCSGGDSR